MVSGLLSGCVLLVAFSIYTEGKAVSIDRQKRAPISDSMGGPAPVDMDPALKEEYVNLFVNLLSSAVQSNPDLYQNFLAYPRSGRSGNPMSFTRDARAMFSYPRLGKKWAGAPGVFGDFEACCNVGIKTFCRASECCSDLREVEDVAEGYTLCIKDNSQAEEKSRQPSQD